MILIIFQLVVAFCFGQLGAKKVGGLGAQKAAKIDFAELEKTAEAADKAHIRLSVSSSGSDKKLDEKEM